MPGIRTADTLSEKTDLHPRVEGSLRPRADPREPQTCSSTSVTAGLPRVLPSPDGNPLPSPGTADTFRAFAQDLTAG